MTNMFGREAETKAAGEKILLLLRRMLNEPDDAYLQRLRGISDHAERLTPREKMIPSTAVYLDGLKAK